MILKIASRRSPLAIAQVDEVLSELNQHHASIQFDCIFLDTIGDKDQKTSLRSLDKTDFFTKEIDELLLNKSCRIAIHSAKDLPNPLPNGLTMVALTNGVDSSDSLILPPGVTPANIKQSPMIATSSERREEAVSKMIPHAVFTDIRGNVNQRLQILDEEKVDGLVVAEAAIIRLGLTHLNRFKLPGETTALQGQLAIIARSRDKEMGELFSVIDCRALSYE